MKRNSITKRLSLRAKFKGSDLVEVTIMNEKNEVQIELIPIKFDNVSSSAKENLDKEDK